MRYEDVIRKVCGDDWKSSREEVEGAIGVACVVAYLRGVQADKEMLAKHLNIHSDAIARPFSRLYHYGAFSFMNLKKDKDIMLHQIDGKENQITWCHLAGIASGLAGNFPVGNP